MGQNKNICLSIYFYEDSIFYLILCDSNQLIKKVNLHKNIRASNQFIKKVKRYSDNITKYKQKHIII